MFPERTTDRLNSLMEAIPEREPGIGTLREFAGEVKLAKRELRASKVERRRVRERLQAM
jgi:hypothetical protein